MTSNNNPSALERTSKSTTDSQVSDFTLVGTDRAAIAQLGSQMVQVISPITLSCTYLIILVQLIELNNDDRLNMMAQVWTKVGLGTDKEAEFSRLLWTNSLIVVLFALIIIFITLIILLIFYLEWHRCLSYYFYLPSLIVMTILTPIYLRSILRNYNVGLDCITTFLLIWNFTVMGIISIFGVFIEGPRCLQQFYLIHNSSIVAVLILYSLPSWAPWLLLIFLIGWDLFAVLAPCGPLNLIIGMAEKGGVVEMPGLIYTTEAKGLSDKRPKFTSSKAVVEDKPGNNETTQLTSKIVAQPDSRTMGEDTGRIDINKNDDSREIDQASFQSGMNIGLGDFIFCSLLIGLTCRGENKEDFYITLAAINAIQVGLVVTLTILATNRRALPALPISLAMGIITSLGTYLFVPDLANELATQQIFV